MLRRRQAFTLIAMLVVISIVAVIPATALPALTRARRSGAMVRETAALKQTVTAYTVYAQDNRGALLPGYAAPEWVAPSTTPGLDPAHPLAAYSSDSPQSRLYGTTARRYTWRLASYLGYSLGAIVVDKRLRSQFTALPDHADAEDGFQYAFASSPSFGLNSTWIGGDARRGGF